MVKLHHARFWKYTGNHSSGHDCDRYDPHEMGLPLISAMAYFAEREYSVSGVSLDGWEVCEPNGCGNGILVRGAEAWFGRAAWSDETKAAARFVANAPRLLEIAQEQAAEIARLKQYTCEACADADSCDRVGRATNRQCAAFRVVTKK